MVILFILRCDRYVPLHLLPRLVMRGKTLLTASLLPLVLFIKRNVASAPRALACSLFPRPPSTGTFAFATTITTLSSTTTSTTTASASTAAVAASNLKDPVRFVGSYVQNVLVSGLFLASASMCSVLRRSWSCTVSSLCLEFLAFVLVLFCAVLIRLVAIPVAVVLSSASTTTIRPRGRPALAVAVVVACC